MLSPDDRRIARRLKRRLSDVAPVLVDVRVFGSRARGDATPESDLDIFIELETASRADRSRIADLAWEVGFDEGLVIFPFVVTREQLEQGPVGANPIMRRILTEGAPV